MARRRKSSPAKPILFVILLAALAYGLWTMLQGGDDQPREPGPGGSAQSAPAGGDSQAGGEGGSDAAGEQDFRAETQHFLPPPAAEGDSQARRQALQDYREGLSAYQEGSEQGVIQARELLSRALASSLLDDASAERCRRALTDIAEQVVFSRRVWPGDQYARRYEVPDGHTLIRIVREEECYVPYEGIQRVNGMNSDMIRAGQTLKIIQGPFHAIVTKHTFTLDLYQQGMFVKSYRVGLGSNGSTPVGLWRVAPGGRVRHATWTDPRPDAEVRTIEWGQPGYPLGTEGLWIALEGLDENTEMFHGYGIHGTDEPESIGRAASLGCIRLADADIAEVYAFLFDGNTVFSKVEVRP